MESLIASFDESSARLQAQYDRARSMLSASDHDGASDAFRALHNSFVAHTDAASRAWSAVQLPEERAACEMADEVSALAAELRLLRACTRGSGSAVAAERTAWDPAGPMAAASTAHCAALRASLRGLLARPAAFAASAPHAALAVCGVATPAQWAAREAQLRAEGGEAAKAIVDSTVALGRRAAAHIAEGVAERERRDRSVADALAQQRRLVVWCRQQRANLDALREPEHVQDYCAALLKHYPLMSRNCKVLRDAADPLLAEGSVQDALLEVSEAWLHLQVAALERFRETLFELRVDVPLPTYVLDHATYSSRAAALVARLPEALGEDSGTPFGREAQELQRALTGVSSELERKLREFAERMVVLREAYECFRTVGLARVTHLSTLDDVLEEAKQRREEFDNCVEELQAWADKRGRSEAWCDIRGKVRDIQELLKREMAMEGYATNSKNSSNDETILRSREE